MWRIMKILIAVVCAAFGVMYAWTWNPVFLVPLVSGLIALVASCLRTRLEASARLTDPDYDRKVKEAHFRYSFPCFGILFLAAAVYSFFTAGLSWFVLLMAVGGPYCLW